MEKLTFIIFSKYFLDFFLFSESICHSKITPVFYNKFTDHPDSSTNIFHACVKFRYCYIPAENQEINKNSPRMRTAPLPTKLLIRTTVLIWIKPVNGKKINMYEIFQMWIDVGRSLAGKGSDSLNTIKSAICNTSEWFQNSMMIDFYIWGIYFDTEWGILPLGLLSSPLHPKNFPPPQKKKKKNQGKSLEKPSKNRILLQLQPSKVYFWLICLSFWPEIC